MKYLVMENHTSHSIVLDEKGRVVKVANLNYEVGQTITEVVAQRDGRFVVPKRFIFTLGTIAACFIFVFAWYFMQDGDFSEYASIYLTVNPQIKIEVDKKNIVGEIEALNGDGAKLLYEYEYKKKSAVRVMEELLDKAIELNMLTDGGEVTVDIEAEDKEWFAKYEEEYKQKITDYLSGKISATVKIQSYHQNYDDDDNDVSDDGYDDDDSNMSSENSSLEATPSTDNSPSSEATSSTPKGNQHGKDDGETSGKQQGKPDNAGQWHISKDEAMSIALNHVGIAKTDVSITENELDCDDGGQNHDKDCKYKMSFTVDNLEYDYEIDAKTGAILKGEKDTDDD